MKAVVAGCAVALAGSTALAGELHITSHPAQDQQVRFVGGHEAIVSVKAHGVVILALNSGIFDEKQGPAFTLAAKNLDPAATNLTAEAITVETDAGAGKVLTGDDLQARARSEARRQVMWAKVGMFGAAMQAASASSNTGTFDATTTHVGGFTQTTGSYTVPNPGEQIAAQRSMAQFASRARAATDNLPATEAQAWASGFAPTTLEMGRDYITPMPVDRLPRKATTMTVRVTLNGEPHEFIYQVAR